MLLQKFAQVSEKSFPLHVGILQAYDDPAWVAPGAYGNTSVRLAQHWASLHNYSYFLEKDLAGLSHLPPIWNKIAAVQKYLPKVDILFWMDLDIFILDASRPATMLLKQDRDCASTGQPHLDARLARIEDEVFFWSGEGTQRQHPERPGLFRVNNNFGLFALQNTPRSFELLDEIWKRGPDPDAPRPRLAPGKSDYSQWPAEQGAMWDSLLERDELLQRSCILPHTVLSPITLERPQTALAPFHRQPGTPEAGAGAGPFALHATGWPCPGCRSKQQRRLELAWAACSHVLGASACGGGSGGAVDKAVLLQQHPQQEQQRG